MAIDFNTLTAEQQAFVMEYSAIHKKLTTLQGEMADIEKRTLETISELEDMRLKETKIFENGEEK